jgi:hypothetical protein
MGALWFFAVLTAKFSDKNSVSGRERKRLKLCSFVSLRSVGNKHIRLQFARLFLRIRRYVGKKKSPITSSIQKPIYVYLRSMYFLCLEHVLYAVRPEIHIPCHATVMDNLVNWQDGWCWVQEYTSKLYNIRCIRVWVLNVVCKHLKGVSNKCILFEGDMNRNTVLIS